MLTKHHFGKKLLSKFVMAICLLMLMLRGCDGLTEVLERCTDTHVASAVEHIQLCEPRPVILKLPRPNNTNVHQMTPTHVTVNKCNGACHRTGQTCISSKTKLKSIPILFGECGIGTGKCEKVCSTITVEEDVECFCGCDLKRLKCKKDLHRLNSALCGCECKNQAAKEECLNHAHVWSEDSCQCQNGQQMNDCSYQDNISSTTELAVIGTLGILVTFMILLTIILLRRIFVLQRRIQLQESLRNVQNIDTFYEFMTKNATSDAGGCKQNKYENVCAVSQTSEVSSSTGSHTHQSAIYSPVDTVQPTKASQDCNKTRNIDYLESHFDAASKPIDEALFLLKLSTDQL